MKIQPISVVRVLDVAANKSKSNFLTNSNASPLHWQSSPLYYNLHIVYDAYTTPLITLVTESVKEKIINPFFPNMSREQGNSSSSVTYFNFKRLINVAQSLQISFHLTSFQSAGHGKLAISTVDSESSSESSPQNPSQISHTGTRLFNCFSPLADSIEEKALSATFFFNFGETCGGKFITTPARYVHLLCFFTNSTGK